MTAGGSVAVLGHILEAVCDAGDEVVFPWRSFEAYPILVAVAESPHGLRAMEIAQALGLGRQTTYHLLHTLIGAGMLARKGYPGDVAYAVIRDALADAPEHRRD